MAVSVESARESGGGDSPSKRSGIVEPGLGRERQRSDRVSAKPSQCSVPGNTVGIGSEYDVEELSCFLEFLEVDGVFLVPENRRYSPLATPTDQLREMRQPNRLGVAISADLVLPRSVGPLPCRFDEQEIRPVSFEDGTPIRWRERDQAALGRKARRGHLVEDRGHNEFRR